MSHILPYNILEFYHIKSNSNALFPVGLTGYQTYRMWWVHVELDRRRRVARNHLGQVVELGLELILDQLIWAVCNT